METELQDALRLKLRQQDRKRCVPAERRRRVTVLHAMGPGVKDIARACNDLRQRQSARDRTDALF